MSRYVKRAMASSKLKHSSAPILGVSEIGRGICALKKTFLLLLCIVVSPFACSDMKPSDQSESIESSYSSQEVTHEHADSSQTENSEAFSDENESINIKPNALVPQARYLQEVLLGREQLDNIEVIPFSQISEIIPNPQYASTSSALVLLTMKMGFYGDGGNSYIEPYIGLHQIAGDTQRVEAIKGWIMGYAVSDGFPLKSSISKISLDGKRFIFSDFINPYGYVFDGAGFAYWVGSYSCFFSDDMTFAISSVPTSTGTAMALVNHSLGKMAILPDCPYLAGNACLITRDHRYVIFIDGEKRIMKYSLLEGAISVVFCDESMEKTENLSLISTMNNEEVYFERNGKQYILNTETGESKHVGDYMFSITQSPNGEYIAFTHPHWLYARWLMIHDGYHEYGERFDEEDYGSIVQNAETGEIVKFIPGEYVVGWFYD